MRGLRGTGPLIWQRVVTSWRLLVVLAFGMLVAATLLASSPVYTRVMNDLGLESSLKERLGRDTRNSAIQVSLPFGTAPAANEAAYLRQVVSEEVGWFTGYEVRYGSLYPMTLTREGEAPSTDPLRPLIAIQSASDTDSHSRFLQGGPAKPTTDPTQLEVTVPAESAEAFHLEIGDRIVGIVSFDDCNRLPPTNDPEEIASRARNRCVPGAFITLSATMTVVGIIEQADQDDPYWVGTRISFERPFQTDTQGPIMVALLPEQSYYEALSQALPRFPSMWQISSFADLSKIDSAQMPKVRESIATLRQRLEEHGALADTPMGAALGDFNQRASFNQVTLLLLLLQVVGIAIYYVLLVSSLLVERRSEEIAMLRSRGASVWQVTGLAAAEAAMLAVIVGLIAPFLASAVVSLLGLTGTFKTVSDGGLLPFTLVPQSFVLGFAGAAIAAVAVVVPAFFTARQGMVVFLRGNARPGPPILQRYYLDIGLVALAALALWQVNQRGSVFDPESVGGWSADPLLLLSPLLVIVAVGVMMFRFLPFLLGIFGKLIAATAGPTSVTLGLWQMTRSPSRYTQLALLVVMAAAVGTFAATYGETTERSQEERARFEVGVDLRLDRLGALDRWHMDRVASDLGSIPGVESASGVFRRQALLGPLTTGGNGFTLLGIDPGTAASQVWFRDDFSDESLNSLMGRLAGSQNATGLIDLGDAQAISLWIKPSVSRNSTLLWLRTVDAAGFYRLHEVSRLNFTEYEKFTVSLEDDLDEIVKPFQLAGILMTQPGVQDLTRGDVLIDDIAVVDAAGRERIVEDFEGGFRWDVLRTPTRNRDTVDRALQPGAAHRGQGAVRYSFLAGQNNAVRGLYVTDPNIPIPAIASRNFLEQNGLGIGGEAEIVLGAVLAPISIQGVVDYFPTMADSSEGFVIVNMRHFVSYAELTTQSNGIYPNEAWLTVSSDPAERAAVHAALAEQFSIGSFDTIDVQERLNSLSNDPIVRAGGSGVLLIALIAAFAILALGFGLTLYLGGQARSLEVSVLRAVGLAPRQVFTMICLEYLLVAVIGLIVGTFAGLRISSTMLDFLNVTETGDRLLPPFALSTRWDTVAIAFLATAAAFMVGIVALAGYFLRLPVSRVLRLTR